MQHSPEQAVSGFDLYLFIFFKITGFNQYGATSLWNSKLLKSVDQITYFGGLCHLQKVMTTYL